MEHVGEMYAEAGVTAARRDFNITQFVSGPLHGPVGSEVPVEVEGADLFLMGDGEEMGEVPATVECSPGVLRLIVG